MPKFNWFITTRREDDELINVIMPFEEHVKNTWRFYMGNAKQHAPTLLGLLTKTKRKWRVYIPTIDHWDDFRLWVVDGFQMATGLVIGELNEVQMDKTHLLDHLNTDVPFVYLGETEETWMKALNIDFGQFKSYFNPQTADYSELTKFCFWVATVKTLPFMGERLFFSKVRPPVNPTGVDRFWEAVKKLNIPSDAQLLVILNRTGVADGLMPLMVRKAVEQNAVIFEFDERNEGFEIMTHHTSDLLLASPYRTLPEEAGPVKGNYKYVQARTTPLTFL